MTATGTRTLDPRVAGRLSGARPGQSLHPFRTRSRTRSERVGDTTVGSGPTAFSSSFVVPPAGSETTVLASREWVGSGDLRYWMNGVADRFFYDSTVFDPKTSIDPGTVSVTDGGQWAGFAGGTPDRVWVDKAGVDSSSIRGWNLKRL